MIKIFLTSIILLIGCNSKKNKKEYNISNTIINHENSKFTDLMSLNKSEAIKKYGIPHTQEEFIMDDAQGEFRNSISDMYSFEERQRESIVINELTWEKDKDTLITVWYELQQNKYTPKGIYSWRKGSEF